MKKEEVENYLHQKIEKGETVSPILPEGIKNYRVVIKGDNKFKCISAASIIAKVYRDNLMIKLSKKFKNYHWDKNFGYGTRQHLRDIKKFGITKHHRKGFSPIHKML